MHTKSTKRLKAMGYTWPSDKRKRRRLHRNAARDLRKEFIYGVARWHLNQARWFGR